MPIDERIKFFRGANIHQVESEIISIINNNMITVSSIQLGKLSVKAAEYMNLISMFISDTKKVVQYLVNNKKLDLLRALHIAGVVSINEHLEYLSAVLPKVIDDIDIIKKFYRLQNINHELYNPAIGEPIPRKIHLIWLGSDIKVEHYKNIISWKVFNPCYEVNLWIDKKLLVGEEFGSDYKAITQFADMNGMRVRDVDEVIYLLIDQNVYFNSVVGEDRNWGLASNVLRFVILAYEGGIYADTDIECISAIGDLYPTHDIMSYYISRAYGDKGNLLNDNLIAAQAKSETMIIAGKMIKDNYYREMSTSLIATHNRSHRHGDVRATITWFGPRVLADAYLAANYSEISIADNESIRKILQKCTFPMDKVIIGFDNSWFTKNKYNRDVSDVLAYQSLQSIYDLVTNFLESSASADEINHLLEIKTLISEVNSENPKATLIAIEEYAFNNKLLSSFFFKEFFEKTRPHLSDNVLEINAVQNIQNVITECCTESEAINIIEFLSHKVFVEHKLSYAVPLVSIFQKGLLLQSSTDLDTPDSNESSTLIDGEDSLRDYATLICENDSLHDYELDLEKSNVELYGVSMSNEVNLYIEFLKYPIVYNLVCGGVLNRIDLIRDSAKKILTIGEDEYVDAESSNKIDELRSDSTLALTLCDHFDAERLKLDNENKRCYTSGPSF